MYRHPDEDRDPGESITRSDLLFLPGYRVKHGMTKNDY